MGLYDRITRYFDKDKPQKPSSEQSKKAQEFVSKVEADYFSARDARSDYDSDWQTYDQWYEGDQWRDQTLDTEKDWIPQPTTNLVYSGIESIHSHLTASSPRFQLKPTEQGDDELARVVNRVLNFILYQSAFEDEVSVAERIRLKLGTVIWKVWFDPMGAGGMGEIRVNCAHPSNFFPDSNGSTLQGNNECEYCIYSAPRSLAYLQKRWPKTGAMVHPEAAFSDTEIYGDFTVERYGRQRALLKEYWWKADGGVHVAYVANGVELFNSRNQEETKDTFYRHGQLPFIEIPYIRRDKRFWGLSAVGLVKDQQKYINQLDQVIMLNALHTAYPPWKVGRASGVDPRKLTNEFNLIIPCEDPSQVMREQPPRMPTYISNHREIKKREPDWVLGNFDVSQGRTPTGITAASAIMALQEAGNQRSADPKRQAKAGYRKLGLQVVELVKQFYEEERIFRILGEEGQEFFDFNGASLLEQPKRALNEEGAFEETGETREAYFDLRVEVGDALPASKAYLNQLASELLGAQQIDIESYFEIIDLPGSNMILDRLRKHAELGIPLNVPLPKAGERVDLKGLSEQELMQLAQQYGVQVPPAAGATGGANMGPNMGTGTPPNAPGSAGMVS